MTRKHLQHLKLSADHRCACKYTLVKSSGSLWFTFVNFITHDASMVRGAEPVRGEGPGWVRRAGERLWNPTRASEQQTA